MKEKWEKSIERCLRSTLLTTVQLFNHIIAYRCMTFVEESSSRIKYSMDKSFICRTMWIKCVWIDCLIVWSVWCPLFCYKFVVSFLFDGRFNIVAWGKHYTTLPSFSTEEPTVQKKKCVLMLNQAIEKDVTMCVLQITWHSLEKVTISKELTESNFSESNNKWIVLDIKKNAPTKNELAFNLCNEFSINCSMLK